MMQGGGGGGEGEGKRFHCLLNKLTTIHLVTKYHFMIFDF